MRSQSRGRQQAQDGKVAQRGGIPGIAPVTSGSLEHRAQLCRRQALGQVCATGHLRVDECSFLALLQVLTGGRSVILDLSGDEFYRSSALVRSSGWFTEGCSLHAEDLEWAMREAEKRNGK